MLAVSLRSEGNLVIIIVNVTDCSQVKQVAQLSQRVRAAGWVSFGQM